VTRLKSGKLKVRDLKAGFRKTTTARKYAKSKGYSKVKIMD